MSFERRIWHFSGCPTAPARLFQKPSFLRGVTIKVHQRAVDWVSGVALKDRESLDEEPLLFFGNFLAQHDRLYLVINRSRCRSVHFATSRFSDHQIGSRHS